jgi:hypothetical protein
MKFTALAVALLLLAACGTAGKPQDQGKRTLESKVLASYGPRIPDGAILAAGDLTTLRALVDATTEAMTRQVGAQQVQHQCSAPFVYGRDACWPGKASSDGHGYLALDIQGGFCINLDSTTVWVRDLHLEVETHFSKVNDCHANGVLAFPTASLIEFSTAGLPASLYSVSYSTYVAEDAYHSESTYLSMPSPAPAGQAAMESEAAAGLKAAVGAARTSIFSVSRVDGSQLDGLCGVAPAGPAYLATFASDPENGPRRMTVALAGEPARVCSVSAI